MASTTRCYPHSILLLLLPLFLSSSGFGGGGGAASASAYISDDVFLSHGHGGSIGRNLLQAKKSCSVNFEFMNYTILTSQCKGPKYSPDVCCKALKEFACPYAAEINDATSDCAETMFSYINLYGKYPPGLFANECREGKQGLDCFALAPDSEDSNADGGEAMQAFLPLSLLAAAFSVLLLAL